MSQKERLIGLLLQSNPIKERDLDDEWYDGEINEIADHLLANGVIVQQQGEWISAPIKDKGYDSKTIPTCTNCGYQSFITYTFCPECGAKLKEREGKC